MRKSLFHHITSHSIQVEGENDMNVYGIEKCIMLEKNKNQERGYIFRLCFRGQLHKWNRSDLGSKK